MRSNSKINPKPVVAGHFATLRSDSGRLHPRDVFEHFVVPMLCCAVSVVAGFRMSDISVLGILIVSGVIAVIFFLLSSNLFGISANWAEQKPTVGSRTTQKALLIQDLSANSSYASLVAAATASLALFVEASNVAWLERPLAAITVGLLVHLASTFLLVTNRLFLLTITQLNTARTETRRA